MRTKPLLAVAFLALGGSPAALAQAGLPGDWEQKVAAVVKDPARARQVAEAGQRYDAKRRDSLDAMKRGEAKVREVFLGPRSSAADRGISLSLFREARREAVISSVDTLFQVKVLVSKKEWKEIWPEGYFALGAPAPPLAVKLQEALPSVVADPARLRQAMDVATLIVKAAKANAASRDRARSRFESRLADYGSGRDEFIELSTGLEESQTKTDDALVDDANQLREILTTDEWGALGRRLTPAAP